MKKVIQINELYVSCNNFPTFFIFTKTFPKGLKQKIFFKAQ